MPIKGAKIPGVTGQHTIQRFRERKFEEEKRVENYVIFLWAAELSIDRVCVQDFQKKSETFDLVLTNRVSEHQFGDEQWGLAIWLIVCNMLSGSFLPGGEQNINGLIIINKLLNTKCE